MLSINSNISSLTAQRNLSSSQSSLSTSLQRLSSGLRINSAKDDAAGLAISDRMSAQIKGLTQATRNANDGISMAQTAEGALANIGDSLQRMRELAVQASNASNTASDRAALQNEATQLMQQIDTVAGQTSFNGVKLLDGSFNSQSFQVGANKGESINIASIANAKTTGLGAGGSSTYSASVSAAAVTAGALTTGGITVNGYNVGPSASDGVSLNGGTTSVTAGDASAFTVVSAGDLTINGVATTAATAAATDAPTQAAALVTVINGISGQTGVTAAIDSNGKLALSAADGRDITVAFGATASTPITGLTAGTTAGAGNSSTSAIAKAAAFNAVSGQTGVTASVTATSVTGAAATAAGAIAGNGTDYIKINGVKLGAIAAAAGTTAAEKASNVTAAINAVTSQTGVTASFDSAGKISLNAADGRNLTVETGGNGSSSGLSKGTTFGGIKLSSTSANGITLGGSDLAKAGLSGFAGANAASVTASGSLASIDISTAAGAQSALDSIDAALASVNSSRANLGALQNRFSSVVSNLSTTSENLSAARSRIQDTDFAAETANLSRNQVLQQAGTAMLAQANQLPQGVLQLLRG